MVSTLLLLARRRRRAQQPQQKKKKTNGWNITQSDLIHPRASLAVEINSQIERGRRARAVGHVGFAGDQPNVAIKSLSHYLFKVSARPPLLSPWPIFMVFNQKSENCAVWKSPTIPTAASTICQKNTNAHIALLDCLSHKAMQNGGSRRSNSFFLLLTLQTWNVTISKMSIESAGKSLLYYLGLPEF